MLSQYLLSFWQTISAWDVAAYIGGAILVSSFLEKVFQVEFVGRRILRLAWRIAKFFLRWFFMPFQPQIDASKSVIFASKELEKRFSTFLEAEVVKSRQFEEMTLSIARIEKEVSYNSGSSIKDAVHKLAARDEEKWQVLDSLLDFAHETTLRLKITDEAANRMSFKVDPRNGCTYISESYLRFFGYTQSDCIGLNWDFCIAEKHKKSASAKWKRAFKTKALFHNEQIIIDSDGNEHRCLVRGFPLVDAGGILKCFYGTIEVIEEEVAI
jgi:PAS domain S-box-containing protein